jgi:5S rRNA maturation endonuclease (ribonuclease M5)
VDWVEIAQPIAIELLGEPTSKKSDEWRWGRKGSLVLNLESASWYDHEADQGGGIIDLINYKGGDVAKILEPYNVDQIKIPRPTKPKTMRLFNREQMINLFREAELHVKYSDDFMVMRFPTDHFIKQKYAPFTRHGAEWSMKRPEGVLPIYVSDKDKDSHVIIVEGEKAMKGGESIYKGDVCCHHGGVSNWQNCDWSKLKDRKAYIFPDNDEAGKKFAHELKEHLNDICESVDVIKIPRAFKDKDDLWDAKVNEHWKSSEEFIDYCQSNIVRARVSFELIPVGRMISDIRKPEWLINDVCEKESVIAIFGQAKAGKSFVTVDMAACIALGKEWHGHKAHQAPVVYLAGEGIRNISRRFLAWSKINKADIHQAPLMISSRGARLLDDKDHQLLKDTISATEDQHGDIGMIIVDTLARNFGGGNENSTEDMNAFIERIDDLKDTFKSCISIVHHTGHNSGTRARGSSVLPAAVDAEYKVVRKDVSEEMFVTFSQTLIKDGQPMKPKDFRFEVLNLPFEDLSSGALVEVEDIPVEKAMSELKIKILEVIKTIQEKEDEPAMRWVKNNEIANYMNESRHKLSKPLKELKDQDLINWEDKKGYQVKDFDDGIF